MSGNKDIHMTGRERILTAMRGEQPDRVPFDLFAFNRAAMKRFKLETGSDDPDIYFDAPKDIGRTDFAATQIDVKEMYMPYHQLPSGLTYQPNEDLLFKIPG